MKGKSTLKIQKKETGKEVKISLQETDSLSRLMKKFKNVPEMSAESFLLYLDFQDVIERHSGERRSSIQKVAEIYGLVVEFNKALGDYVYSIEKHDKKDEIVLKMSAIEGKEIALYPNRFLAPIEFQKITEGLHFETIRWLKKFLLK